MFSLTFHLCIAHKTAPRSKVHRIHWFQQRWPLRPGEGVVSKVWVSTGGMWFGSGSGRGLRKVEGSRNFVGEDACHLVGVTPKVDGFYRLNSLPTVQLISKKGTYTSFLIIFIHGFV